MGVKWGSDIKVLDNGFIEFKSLYFGSFQVVVLSKEPAVELSEKISTRQALLDKDGSLVASRDVFIAESESV